MAVFSQIILMCFKASVWLLFVEIYYFSKACITFQFSTSINEIFIAENIVKNDWL